jgi:uncharacterized protein (DUF2384 family)
MTKEDRHTPLNIDALRARFQEQSRTAQAYYTVMHAVRDIAGSDDAASAWMAEPLAAFDGRTPAQLVSDGRTEELLAYVSTLTSDSSNKAG